MTKDEALEAILHSIAFDFAEASDWNLKIDICCRTYLLDIFQQVSYMLDEGMSDEEKAMGYSRRKIEMRIEAVQDSSPVCAWWDGRHWSAVDLEINYLPGKKR